MGTQTPPAGTASTRARLLDAAAKLFHEQGIHVGVDAVCRAAGVSKRSMYQLFAGKEDLVAASLERVAPEYSAALLPAADDGGSPRERIRHVFERLEELEPAQDFLGCPFVATAVQARSPEHPASLVARRQKDGLTAFFRHEARRGGARDPELLARQLTMVFDGASVRSVMQARELDGLAVTTANALMEVAGMGPPAASGDGAVLAGSAPAETTA
ncbi:TetR/AcrR family transcriptional regulator [Actinoplanes sp. NEAU-A12]|uniref:TetR/AcrR family transcriptional regulator n=1 Tax=Actinoplanes sandaracinus TaxID=3045177 RepID=A0ABT6WWU4_9ACTN|nr:TetR/AcrR family transcriptional regulator [Actinoplanes sandaracinus]MDI6104217.1 TetR/AcrR family transcriptional regulator [Actinoplanes sandaracinus]